MKNAQFIPKIELTDEQKKYFIMGYIDYNIA